MNCMRQQEAGRGATNTGYSQHRTGVTDSLNESVGASGWRDGRVEGAPEGIIFARGGDLRVSLHHR